MTSKPSSSLGNPRLGLGSDVQGLMSIGDMARTFNVSQRTLRFYEDRGLLSPRRDGSTRLYGASERQRLDMILRAKRLGFTLTEIIRFADRSSAESPAFALDRDQISAQIEHLERQRRSLDMAIGELQAAQARLVRP